MKPGFRSLRIRIPAIALTLLLIATTTSCGRVDEFAGATAGTLKDVEGAVDSVTDSEKNTTNDSEGQTVSRPPRPTGSLTTGAEKALVSETVGPSGGAVIVNNSGDPLDGLEIQVPAGSYPDSRPFDVSSTPVDGHTFGEYFTPATPLITIDNGGEYSDELMTVTIPVEIPPDHFAMAFYYDEVTGTLEGIPFNAMDEHSITIITRHFCDIIVSIINNTLLDDLLESDIDSHFRPGIDDWQFTNYGSYVADGGHCAGQSIAAMWYYCEQPDGQDLTLNGRYDKNGRQPATPDLWQDDSYGYRLASVVQDDIDWGNFGVQFQMELRGKDDLAHYKAFAYTIALTSEPQYVGLASSAGGGHAMVVYRVYKNNLYVADPNYPGNTERRIELANGRFKPYNSGANAAEIAAGNTTNYDSIGYRAKTSMVNWAQVSARWKEFKAGTIGDDKFPQYQIVVVDHEGNEKALTDGYKSKEQKITIRVKSDAAIGQKVYRNGTRMTQDSNGKYELEEGNNLIGIDIWGDVNNNPQSRKYRYIDFQYFNVQYGQSECHGWVLDSVEEKECVVRPSNEYDRDVSFTATGDGMYRGSGQKIIPTVELVGDVQGDVLADYSVSGSWLLPDCVRPGETALVTLTSSTSLTLSHPTGFADVANNLRVSSPNMRLGTIEQMADSAHPTMDDTVTTEWQCLSPGGPGQSFQVTVYCGTSAGWAEYAYTYVWQD